MKICQDYEQTPEELRNKGPPKLTAKEINNITAAQEIERQDKEIEFGCAMTCISLIRFITDHMEALPASIIHALMDTADLPL